MDLVGYDRQVFDRIVTEYRQFAEPLGIPDITCIPLSALKGDNVVEASENMSWYTGKPLLEYLETVHIGSDKNFADLRYPVQYVMRPNLDFRGFSSTVASGIIRKGDEVVALPSMKRSRVKSIVTYDGEPDFAFPPQAITVTLEDEIDISRGEMLVHPDNLPIISRNFEAMLVWMDEKKMDPEEFYERALPYMKEVITKDYDFKKIAQMVKTRIEIFPDIRDHIDFFETLPEYDIAMYTHKKMKANAETSLKVLKDVLPILEAQEDFSNDALFAALSAYVSETGVKTGFVMWPIRTAVSGKQMTPGGATELMEVLGKEESLARIRKGIELLSQAQ